MVCLTEEGHAQKLWSAGLTDPTQVVPAAYKVVLYEPRVPALGYSANLNKWLASTDPECAELTKLLPQQICCLEALCAEAVIDCHGASNLHI